MPVLQALALLVASASAVVPTWPGAVGFNSTTEVTLPAGPLATGPAVLRVVDPPPGMAVQEVRFAVVHDTPTRVRILLPTSWDEHTLEATSEVDGSWTTKVNATGGAVEMDPSPRFLGTPDQYARFMASLGPALTLVPTGATRPLDLQVHDPTVPIDCRTQASATLLVADAAVAGDHVGPCIARGAATVLVSPTPPLGLEAWPAGEVFRWGRGLVAWAPAFDETAARATLWMQARREADTISPLDSVGLGWSADEGTRVGPAAALVLLVLYVLVIGPVGWFVGIRPRRMAVAWGWFPAVAAGATLAAVAISFAWKEEPFLHAARVTVLAPDGLGLDRVDLTLRAPYGEAIDLTLPWGDADLTADAGSYEFGSPFGTPTRVLRAREDRITGVMKIQGMRASRFATRSVGWVVPTRGPAAQAGAVSIRDGERYITNPTPQTAAWATVLCGQETAWFQHLEPGVPTRFAAGQALSPTSTAETPWEPLTGLSSTSWALPGSCVAAFHLESAPLEGMELQPPVPAEEDRIVLVAGPDPLVGPAREVRP